MQEAGRVAEFQLHVKVQFMCRQLIRRNFSIVSENAQDIHIFVFACPL